jgi:hypothetical protein
VTNVDVTGNVAENVEVVKSEDLVTPNLKSAVFTSGRGGSGNMATNDPTRPEVARAAQDVEGHAPRLSMGEFHAGRGGAGNAGHGPSQAKSLAVAQGDVREGMNDVEESEVNEKNVDYRGWADKGKDLLFGRRK